MFSNEGSSWDVTYTCIQSVRWISVPLCPNGRKGGGGGGGGGGTGHNTDRFITVSGYKAMYMYIPSNYVT